MAEPGMAYIMGGDPAERKGDSEPMNAMIPDPHDEAAPAWHGAAVIPPEMAGERIDRALVAVFPEYSRARLQQWLREGMISVDGETPRASDKVRGGEQVTLAAQHTGESAWGAEEVAFRVVYEDAALIVVDKPAGLVVHPGAGNPAGTLVNGLLHRMPELAAVPRGGIVHRLDKDTSGLLVVARTLAAHKALVDQLQERSMGREYEAVACGTMTAGGTVDLPIGRHPRVRTRMAVVERGKPAVTHYRVIERFAAHTWLRVKLETGRTHQIRVHLAHVRHPLVGDPEYGGRLRLPAEASAELRAALAGFGRQALHAARLSLLHPVSGEPMEWAAPLPADMTALIAALRAG
jgi:23S rRNA pseudouridine1911/1915/1917 synthase